MATSLASTSTINGSPHCGKQRTGLEHTLSLEHTNAFSHWSVHLKVTFSLAILLNGLLMHAKPLIKLWYKPARPKNCLRSFLCLAMESHEWQMLASPVVLCYWQIVHIPKILCFDLQKCTLTL